MDTMTTIIVVISVTIVILLALIGRYLYRRRQGSQHTTLRRSTPFSVNDSGRSRMQMGSLEQPLLPRNRFRPTLPTVPQTPPDSSTNNTPENNPPLAPSIESTTTTISLGKSLVG
tara:strand:+ start:565 stop:909 length:345 start_codon:yes stop_codon:yes gene_type:complete